MAAPCKSDSLQVGKFRHVCEQRCPPLFPTIDHLCPIHRAGAFSEPNHPHSHPRYVQIGARSGGFEWICARETAAHAYLIVSCARALCVCFCAVAGPMPAPKWSQTSCSQISVRSGLRFQCEESSSRARGYRGIICTSVLATNPFYANCCSFPRKVLTKWCVFFYLFVVKLCEGQ